jgi:hypothetical protein
MDAAPQQAYANIQKLRQLYPGVYGSGGFFDAVNPQTGSVGHRYLVLDQSMIMAALDIVRRRGNDLDEHTIREQLDGNICRCTGYHNIVKAIAAGAKAMGKGGSPTRQAAE